MKSILLIGAILFGFGISANAESPLGDLPSIKPIEITTKISTESQPIYSFEQIQEVSKTFDAAEIYKAQLTLKVAGILEGNFCGYQTPVLQVTQERGGAQDTKSIVYNVNILTLKDADPVDLRPMGCALSSSHLPFSANLQLGVFAMPANREEITLKYYFRHEWGANKVLSVVLSKVKGWSWKFSDI